MSIKDEPSLLIPIVDVAQAKSGWCSNSCRHVLVLRTQADFKCFTVLTVRR